MTVSKQEIQEYVNVNLDVWVRRILLDEIKRHAEAANMPHQFIDHIQIQTDGLGKYQLINDWSRTTKYGKALLAIYFEYGTRDHWIQPRFAKVLRWGHREPQGGQKRGYGHAIFFERFDTKPGDTLFSKGHYVTGLPKTLAMTRGYQTGKARLVKYIKEQIANHFRGR